MTFTQPFQSHIHAHARHLNQRIDKTHAASSSQETSSSQEASAY